MKEKCEPTEMLFVFIKSELSKSFAQSGAAEFLFFFWPLRNLFYWRDKKADEDK